MATELAAACGGPAPVVTGRYRLGDVRHVTGDPSRACSELGFVAGVPFADGGARVRHRGAARPLTCRPIGRPLVGEKEVVRPLDDAVRAATATLTATGVPTAAADAEALARHVLDGDSSDAFDDPAERAFAELVRRRAQRVPLAHLTGRVPFRQVELLVGPGVFVPQPETASVVQWVVDAVRARRWAAPLMVDLCTGTGTIACTLANELPTATAHAVEQDLDALAWARRNTDARARAGDSRVHLHHGSAGDALPELNGQVDLVVSNPPYVATTETHIPQPEVVEHDPAVALWAGADGLDVVREVERAARRLLKPGGLVVVEHSDRQGQTAPALFLDTGGWTEVADHRDQDGHDRFVTARWTRARHRKQPPGRPATGWGRSQDVSPRRAGRSVE